MSTNDNKDPNWERDLLNRLAFASLNEQRRTRRWGIFFKLLIFVYIFAIFFLANPHVAKMFEQYTNPEGLQHTALIEVNGVIAANADASADMIVSGLRDAFDDANTAGVILRINSPGGSPVQAGYINDEIKRLKKLHPKIPVYAVITDLCASGGYYIASAADFIYADKASLVGSIGVIMGSFGFVQALDKLGVERRVYTAGEHKSFLDPFSPTNETDIAHIKTMLGEIHQQFIDVVKTGRGDRLKVADHPELFSGYVWTGEKAVALGLVDGLGSSSYVARELIKVENLVNFTPQKDYFQKFTERMGTSLSQTLFQQLGLNAASLQAQ